MEVWVEGEKKVKEDLGEMKDVVGKIGSGEVGREGMGVEDGDVMIVMKGLREWRWGRSGGEMVEKMKK